MEVCIKVGKQINCSWLIGLGIHSQNAPHNPNSIRGGYMKTNNRRFDMDIKQCACGYKLEGYSAECDTCGACEAEGKVCACEA